MYASRCLISVGLFAWALGAQADPLDAHIEVDLPPGVRSVGDAAIYYAAAVGWRFTCATPATGDQSDVCATPAPRPPRRAPPLTVADALASLAPGFEVRTFPSARLVTFAPPAPIPLPIPATPVAQLAVEPPARIDVEALPLVVTDIRLPPVALSLVLPAAAPSSLTSVTSPAVAEPQPVSVPDAIAEMVAVPDPAAADTVVLRIPRGGFLSRALEQFAMEHGLTVRWRAGVDFPVIAPAEFVGSTPQAVIATVIRSTASTRAPLSVIEHAGNLTVSRL